MKYLFLFIISAAMAACNNTDQKAVSTPDKAKKDSIRMAAVKDSANFTTLQWLDSVNQNLGKIEEGQVVEIAWHFKNTGNKPLYIGSVRPGCGCTVAEEPVDAIEPGKEGVIKAKFNSQGHPNMNTKEVFVVANNRNRNDINDNVLKFTIEVVPKK